MTKYYFASYMGIIGCGSTKYGHCILTVKDRNLTEIAEMIAKEDNMLQATILCLKDLSKEEYKMLTSEDK